MKQTGFYEYVYDFSVNYDTIAVNDILYIHKYLMKRQIIKCLDFILKKIIVTIGFIGLNANAIPLKCVSMRNQKFQKRLTIMNIIRNEPLFYPSSCNHINNPYAKLQTFVMFLLKTQIFKYLI